MVMLRDLSAEIYSRAASFTIPNHETNLTNTTVDLLKTRMQQGDGALATRNFSISKTTYEVIAHNGFKGLWRGTTASLARNVPGIALYMTGLSQLRALMATSPYFARVQQHPAREASLRKASSLPSLTSCGNLIAGASARVTVGILLNPISVLKARYESNMYSYGSLLGGFKSIIRQGPSEMFRGVLASSLRDAPYAGIFIVFYEGIKHEASILFPVASSVHATAIHTISAASAGAIATLATHPFDVIKTKVQVRSEDRYHGFFRTMGTIWNQRGIAGYFDGASLRLSRKVLSSVILWAVYEGMLLFVMAEDKA